MTDAFFGRCSAQARSRLASMEIGRPDSSHTASRGWKLGSSAKRSSSAHSSILRQAPRTRDPADDYLVSLGRESAVDAIISLDLDLLDAGLADPPDWTPRQPVELLSKE